MRSDRPLVNLFLERCREFWREPGVLFWTFGFPMLLTIVLSMAFSEGGAEEFAVAVVDGAGAEPLMEALEADDSIDAERLAADEARARLGRGAVAVMVDAGEQDGPLVFTFDPSRPGTAFAAQAVRDALERNAGRADVLEVRTESVTARGDRYIDFLLPGLVGMTLMSGGVWLIGYGLILMRTGKLLKRLYATPMRHTDLLLSFALFRLVIAFVEAFVLLAFGWIVYDLPLPADVGALATLIALIATASLSFAGLGLLTGSRAQNPQTGAGWVNVATLPMLMLSGVFFSSENFPDWLQPFVQALPLTALNDGLRAVLNEGAGIAAIGGEFAILAGWGFVCFVIALKVFRWT